MWHAQRKKLLAHEKALTKQHDRVCAERRRLPMVKIEKDYVFDGTRRQTAISKPSSHGRQPTHHLSLHVRPGVEQGLPSLHELCGRPGRSLHAERPRHNVRARFPGAAGQAPGLQSEKRMEHPVVFLVSAAISTTTSMSRLDEKGRTARTTTIWTKAELEKSEENRALSIMTGEAARVERFLLASTATFSTPTQPTRAAPKDSPTPMPSSTRHPMGGSRNLRIPQPAGHRSRRMDEAYQA
jgi:hypothetical protein